MGDAYRIVVGFDFTELGYLALHGAIGTAMATPGSELHVLGVLDARVGLGPITSAPSIEGVDSVQCAIEEIVANALASRGGSEQAWFCHARIGEPAATIVELAAEENAEVIVVGTHGRHGIDRLLHGSVAEHVVRDADCPVLVMRPKVEHHEAEEYQPEPPCEACIEHRRETDGAEMWCSAHDHPTVTGRAYAGSSLAAGSGVRDWTTYNH